MCEKGTVSVVLCLFFHSDGMDAFCYSPEDEDQRRRFCDLFALALASSRDHGLTPSQPGESY